MAFYDAYRKCLSGKPATCAVKKPRGHRKVSQRVKKIGGSPISRGKIPCVFKAPFVFHYYILETLRAIVRVCFICQLPLMVSFD